MRKILLLATMCVFWLSNHAQINQVIGDTTGLNSYFYGPIYRSSAGSSFNFSFYGYAFEASELTWPTGTTVNKIAWKKQSANTLLGGACSLKILMKNSSRTAYNGVKTYDTLVLNATYTTVYNSTTQNITGPADSWVEFTLSSPFVYNGGSIEVSVDFNRSTATSNGVINFYGAANNKGAGYASGTAPTGTSATSSSYSGRRPATRFNITYPAGACIPPSALTATATAPTTGTVSWTTGGAANSLVEYGPAGFVLGSGTKLYVSTTSTGLTGLSPNTKYDVYVKDSCATNASPFAGPASFTTPCASAMNGIYTINSAVVTGGTNFASLPDAAAELSACGVSGPVTLNIVQGTYSGRMDLSAIAGASAANQVIIQPDPSNTSPVILNAAATSSTDNYIIRFNGASFVSVSGLTFSPAGTSFARSIDFSGLGSNVRVVNNTFNGFATNSTSTNFTHVYNNSSASNNYSNCVIKNNTMNNGSYGIYWYGPGSTAPYERGSSLDSNVISEFSNYGIFAYGQTQLKINGNTITGSSSNAATSQYGIYSYYTDTLQVLGNNISINGNASYGIWVGFSDNDATVKGIVANNMIAISAGTSTVYGIYPFNCYYLDVVYNSISVNGGSATAGRGVYLNSSTTGTYGFINVLNNNISNTGAGYTAEVSAAAVTLGYVTSSNYNNIFGTGTTLVRVGTTNYADLASYQTATMLDANSVSSDPLYVGPTDLHSLSTVINNAGTPYAGITTDIDGETRNATTPDIGADEFAPPACGPSSALAAYALFTNSVSLNWIAGAGTSFVIEYGLAGYTQGAGTTVTTTDTFVTVTGLLAQTAYDFYIQDVCGGGNGSSPFVGPVSATTLCGIFGVPFSESFDANSTPICWSQSATSGGPWEFSSGSGVNTSNCPGPLDHTGNGGNFTWMDQSSTDDGVVLQMPDIDVSTLTSPGLEFYYWMCGVGYSPINLTYIETWNGTSWVLADSITTATDGWEYKIFNMTGFTFGSGLLRVRFRAESGGNSSDFFGDNVIDDIKVDEFLTLFCANIPVAPFTESFNTAGTPLCWSQSATTGGPWVINTGGGFNTTCGVATDATGNGGNFAWMDQSSTDANVILEMKDIDVSALTVPYLEFNYRMCGVGYTPANITIVEMFNGTNWVTWDSIQVATNGWEKFGDTITAAQTYNNGLVKVRFRAKSGGSGSDFNGDNGIDDISFIEAPSCQQPSALGATSITATSASVFWMTGGATNWNLEFGISGFTLGTGVRSNETNDTVALSGLTAQTSYDFYVRDSCAVGDVGVWTGPFTFTTLCAPLALPQLETFTGGVPPTTCWDQATNGTPLTGPTGFGSSSWGADGFGNNGTTGSARINLYSTGRSDWLISPQYDLAGTTTPQVEFDFGVFAFAGTAPTSLGSDDTVEVFISTDAGVTYTSLRAFNSTYVTAATGNHEVIDLAAYTGDTVMFAIYGTDGTVSDASIDNDIFIDNFQVREAPSCAAPSALATIATTDSSITITWTGGGAANWNIQYDTTGFAIGTGRNIVAATNDTITINGLMPNTAYDFYVQDSCGVGNVSTYTGPLTVSTGCSILAIPYLETFEVASSPTLSCVSAQAGWALSAVGGFGNSSNSLSFNFYGVTGGNVRNAFIPQFQPVPANYQLSFDFAYATFQTEIDSLEIFYSTDGGVTYTSLVGLDGGTTGALNTGGASGGQFAPTAAQWSNYSIALPVGTNSLRLDAISAFGNDLHIDNLSVAAVPSCPAPTALGSFAITQTTASVYWTSDPLAGGSIVEYGTSGFSLGSGTQVLTMNDTLPLTGLSPQTVYDFYVTDSCGVNVLSAATGPVSFTTACGIITAPYTESFTGTTIPTCWSQGAVTGGPFQFTWTSNPDFGSNNAFPDHTNGTVAANYTWVDMSGTDSAVVLNMPILDVSTLTSPELSFWIVSTTTTATIAPNYNILYAEYNNGTAWVPIDTVQGDFGLNWIEFVVDLTPYLNTASTIELRFRQESGGAGSDFDNDMLLDDVSVREAPACVAPSAFGVDTVTTTTASIYWTSDANAVSGYLEYGLAGFTPGMGTLVGTTNDSLTISSLMANTCYDVYIADTCNDGSVTFLAGPFTFCTACGSFPAPFYESFESSTVNLPICWNMFSTTGELWRFANASIGFSATTGANGTAYFAAFDDSETPSTTDGTLETPFIDISTLTSPTLGFYLFSESNGSGVAAGGVLNATIDVEVYDGAAWNNVFTNTANTNGWKQFFVDLSSLTITGDIKVRFIVDEDHDGGFDDDISIDEITIDERPACFDPTNLRVTGLGVNNIDIAWTSDTTVTSSIVEYGIQGFVLGSGTQLNASMGASSIPGLTSSTCYDFYVLDSCSGGFTTWLGPITACTQAPCLVTTVPTTQGDSVCGGGFVQLAAVAGGSNNKVAWTSNGIIRAVSDTLSDTIGATTTYQAFDYSVTGVAQHVGPLPSIAALGFANFSNGQFITVLDTIYLDSTTVRANGFVNAQVVIRDVVTDRVIQRGSIFETDSTVTANYQVPVDIMLVPGNYLIAIDFNITAVSVGALFRATTGASYPYTLPGLISITGVNISGPRYYYTFDLVVSNACLGTGVPTVAKVLGSSAGLNANASICETETTFNLFSLTGPHTPGGVWSDVSSTGGLTDSIYDATVAGAGGPFNFRYIVGATGGCPADTAFISITADTARSAGVSAAAAYCTNNTSFINLRPLLVGADGGGTWVDVDASGILIGGRIRPSNGTAGLFRFRYIISANGSCAADSATVTVTLANPVEAGADAADTTCVSKGTLNLASYLSANAAAGGTWKDVNGSGGLTGATFNPTNVTPNTTYAFRYVVAGPVGCGNDSATVSIFVCNDVSLSEQALSTVALYPNPTTGVFFVEDADKSTANLSIEILSIDGKLLRKVEFNQNGKHKVDVSELAAGVYNVKVSTEKGIKVFRLITQD